MTDFAISRRSGMKANFAVMNTTWAVEKIRLKKSIQACAGFEPMIFAIPAQSFTNWADTPIRAGLYVGSKKTLELVKKWLWIYGNKICELRMKSWMKASMYRSMHRRSQICRKQYAQSICLAHQKGEPYTLVKTSEPHKTEMLKKRFKNPDRKMIGGKVN